MKAARLAAFVSVALAVGCSSTRSSSDSAAKIYVFAASSLTDAFSQIASAFQLQQPGISVGLNFAGSQALRTQIEQGAPADVFVSASSTDMNALVTDGYVAPDSIKPLLSNRLVVILPQTNPAHIGELQDLGRPQVKVVLAAADVPVGAYARQALQNMNSAFGTDFEQNVLANVVSNEDNVKQVVAKIQLAEADAGIVYVSDAIAAPSLKQIEIPSQWNVVATYPIAILKTAKNAAAAAEFVAFLLSPSGQVILKKWGFGPASP